MLLALSSAFFASDTYPDTILSASSPNSLSYSSAVCAAVSFEKSGLPSSSIGTSVPSSRVIAGATGVCSVAGVSVVSEAAVSSAGASVSPSIVGASTSISPLFSPLLSSIIEDSGIACLYSSSDIEEIVATSSLFTAWGTIVPSLFNSTTLAFAPVSRMRNNLESGYLVLPSSSSTSTSTTFPLSLSIWLKSNDGWVCSVSWVCWASRSFSICSRSALAASSLFKSSASFNCCKSAKEYGICTFSPLTSSVGTLPSIVIIAVPSPLSASTS